MSDIVEQLDEWWRTDQDLSVPKKDLIQAAKNEIKYLKQTIRQMERFVPVSVTCSECDADEGELQSLREIRSAGWVDVEFDDGPSWNFLGVCPECVKKEGGE